MKTLEQWFTLYEESHQNEVNIKVHSEAVPVIFFVTVGLIWLIPNPEIFGTQSLRFFHLIVGLALAFYFSLGKKVFLSMAFFFILSTYLNHLGLSFFSTSYPWVLALTFVVAWIAQFYGHKVDGKKTSFFNEVPYLLIGPLWVLKKFNLLKV